jgi:flagellar L-ring protein precursor FlgH
MIRNSTSAPVALALLLATVPAAAQTNAALPDSAARAAEAAAVRAARASWVSDRLLLRTGDIVTVYVDESTAAREHVGQVATGDHGLNADLNAGLTNDDVRLGPQKSFGSTLRTNSRDLGDASRSGDLVAVLSVRVTGIAPDGSAQIDGKKSVTVDGRTQEIALKGAIRPQDVEPGNKVRSDRIADAVITYKGKKIGPRLGIAGKILAMLWP